MAGPQSVRIRSYQVGFGDCYLLSFIYKTVERHVLIDFGSTGKPQSPVELAGTLKNLMQRTADHIAATCNGKLDAVVATHRHKDHISGFDTDSGPGATIRELNPKVVIQPWTEHPDAEVDAESAPTISSDDLAFASNLRRMDAVAESAMRFAAAMRRRPALRTSHGEERIDELGFLGETNLRNKSAVDNLMSMGSERRYLSYGQDAGLRFSGVKVRVLGPPTLAQFQAIRKQRDEDENEFWMLRTVEQQHLTAADERILFGEFELNGHDPSTVWLRERLQRASLDQRLALVRRMDATLNNTSVILLFEVGPYKLLFPGDAQIENWEWALKEAPDKDDNLALLSDVIVYKCGHHGSRNATPKTLWNNFARRNVDPAPDRLKVFVSTAEGKHGHKENNSEVPRRTLVEAFKQQADFFSTETVDPNAESSFVEQTLELPDS